LPIAALGVAIARCFSRRVRRAAILASPIFPFRREYVSANGFKLLGHNAPTATQKLQRRNRTAAALPLSPPQKTLRGNNHRDPE